MKVLPASECRPVSGAISSRDNARLTELASRIRRRIQETEDEQSTNYEIAGLPVSFRFLDDQIREQISPAFEHLRTEKNIEPKLTVLLDGAGSPLGDIRRLLDWDGWGERDTWVVNVAEMTLIVQRNGMVVGAIDKLNETGYWLELCSTGVIYVERAAPMRHLLTLWFGMHEKYLFHGAAVGESGRGILILGAGGAGKTTTALACLEAGMTYAGDDRCLLSMSGAPYVHSLYGTAKLSDVSQFPALSAIVDVAGSRPNEKAMYRLHRLSDSTLDRGFRLQAIVLARIEGIQETRFRPASHAAGFLALAASGALYPPEMRKQALRCFDSAARRLPVYELTLGANIRSSPDAIKRLLCELH